MERVPRGELVVAANEGTCLHILPEVFAEFKKLYPDVSVNVKRSESPKILEAIIENTIDFGVVSMPVNDKRLTTVVIHRDELVVITPPRHPLSKQKTVTLEQFAKYPLLVPAQYLLDCRHQFFRGAVFVYLLAAPACRQRNAYWFSG